MELLENNCTSNSVPLSTFTNCDKVNVNSMTGTLRNKFYGENWTVGTSDRFGVASGYNLPYTWTLQQKEGGIGSNIGILGGSTFTGSGALGKNAEATINGLGEISSANMGLILSAVSTINGIGGLSADVVGALSASATLAGEGNLTASLGALAGAVATLTGTGSFTSDIIAKGHITADIYVNQSTATVNEIVAGVWNALAADFNTSGTMGNKLNGAGSAGDPWTTDLSTYTTVGTAGALMKKASKPKISL